MPKLTNHLKGEKKYQLQEILLHKLTDAPGTPVSGQIYYNTTSNSTFVYNGTTWTQLNNVAMSDNDILTAIKNVDGAGSGLDADLLDNEEGTYYLLRTNHTGTQTASTISDLKTTVTGYKLNEFDAPNTDVSLNNLKIVNLAAPVNGTDAVNRTYVDTKVADYAQGLDAKGSVVVVATTDQPTTIGFNFSIDGVALSAGNRVLLTAQANPANNGIYIVQSLPWSKAPDATGSNLTKGAYVFVESGTKAGSGWVYTGGANEVWTQFDERSEVVAGTGTTVTTTGRTSTIGIDTTLVARKVVGFVPSGNVSAVISHSLNTQDVSVTIREVSTNEIVLADVVATNTGSVTVTFAEAPTSEQYRYIIIG